MAPSQGQFGKVLADANESLRRDKRNRDAYLVCATISAAKGDGPSA